MNDPREISILDYTYSLPDDSIAHYPLAERDASRLLIFSNDEIKEDQYRNIASHLPGNSFLVFNNTKVVEARLLFQKPTGGVIEIFCLEPHENYPDISTAMMETGSVAWNCLVGGASKWKHGQVLEKKAGDLTLQARYISQANGKFVIALSWTPAALSFAAMLQQAGAMPLPPYIKRPVDAADKDRYQTVYAGDEGSVAAPTAGLHFTPRIFDSFKEKNIGFDFVTLHVGAGTFKPVTSARMNDHTMHAEWIDVSRSTISNLQNKLQDPVVAVGTTSLRTLESLYWIGVKCRLTQDDGVTADIALSQWDAYRLPAIPAPEALQSLLDWMDRNTLLRLVTKTQLLIAPGYDFKIVKGLATNFHQPQSTLLLLVAALIGEKWRTVYDYALQHHFRFLSYGDGCLLWNTSHR